MKHSRIIIYILAAVIVLPSIVAAQAARNTKENLQNEEQIIMDKVRLERDRQEMQEFEGYVASLDAARVTRSTEELKMWNGLARIAMHREYLQAQGRATVSSREVRQSTRELKGERREAHRTGDARDHAQKRDDRRDLRDDKRDRKAAASRARRMGVILTETKELQSAMEAGDGTAFVKGRQLLYEFLHIMRINLRDTEMELAEDRSERREDRRERRTDGNK